MKYIDGPGHTAHTTGNRVSPTGENRRIRHSLTCRRYTLGGRKKKKKLKISILFYVFFLLLLIEIKEKKTRRGEWRLVVCYRLMAISKKETDKEEKRTRKKKKDYLLHLCVYDYQPCFLLDKEMDIRRDIFFFLNIPSFSILHFLLKFYLEKKKKWIAPSSPPVSL